jgi:DUF917 family protein
LLFHGKIVDVERRLFKGHSHGVVVIQHVPNDIREQSSASALQKAVAVGGQLRIPFMNENILAQHIREDNIEEVIASAPDLISVLNASSGKALGIEGYRYGVVVDVLGIACAPIWNMNEKGLKAGGPAAMGYEDVVYRPLGTYKEPRSVIREFS